MNEYNLRIILLCLGIFHVFCETCEKSEELVCQDQLSSLKSNEKFYYADSDETLTFMCSKLYDALHCVNSYAKSCLTEVEQQEYKLLVSGAQNVADELCTEDTLLRKRYLLHSSCIKKVSGSLDNCSAQYEILQQEVDEEDANPDELLQRTCCIFDIHIQCVNNVTRTSCTNDASDLMKELFTKLGGTYLNKRCAELTPNCSGNAVTILCRTDSDYMTPNCSGNAVTISLSLLCLIAIILVHAVHLLPLNVIAVSC